MTIKARVFGVLEVEWIYKTNRMLILTSNFVIRGNLCRVCQEYLVAAPCRPACLIPFTDPRSALPGLHLRPTLAAGPVGYNQHIICVCTHRRLFTRVKRRRCVHTYFLIFLGHYSLHHLSMTVQQVKLLPEAWGVFQTLLKVQFDCHVSV